MQPFDRFILICMLILLGIVILGGIKINTEDLHTMPLTESAQDIHEQTPREQGIGSMVIPDIVKWGIKKRANGEFVEMRQSSDVKYLVFHHFGFVPHDLDIQSLSKSELKNAYYNGYTSHLVQYANDDDLRDTFVPYHYIIYRDSSDGKVKYKKLLETETMCSAHDGLADGTKHKCNSISIAIAGDYRDSEYEPEVVEVMLQLSKELSQYFPIEDILGHKDIDATACPGSHWNDFKPTLMAVLPERKQGNFVAQVSRYYTPTLDQDYYFRNNSGAWVGKYYPEDEASRRAAFAADFRANCWGDCTQGKYGKMRVGAAACPPEIAPRTKFIMNGKEYECVDVGSAIKGNRIDIWAGEGNEGLQMMEIIPAGVQQITILDA